MFYSKIFAFVLILSLLFVSACQPADQPQPGSPTSPSGESVRPERPPEPSVLWLITVPADITWNGDEPVNMGLLTADCGGKINGLAKPVKQGCGGNCNQCAQKYLMHLLENSAARIAEFGGLSVVEAVWQNIADGQFTVSEVAVRSLEKQVAMHVVVNSKHVFVVLGNTPKPTAIPLLTRKGETIAQAAGRLISSFGKRLQKPFAKSFTNDLISMGTCIAKELKNRTGELKPGGAKSQTTDFRLEITTEQAIVAAIGIAVIVTVIVVSGGSGAPIAILALAP